MPLSVRGGGGLSYGHLHRTKQTRRRQPAYVLGRTQRHSPPCPQPQNFPVRAASCPRAMLRRLPDLCVRPHCKPNDRMCAPRPDPAPNRLLAPRLLLASSVRSFSPPMKSGSHDAMITKPSVKPVPPGISTQVEPLSLHHCIPKEVPELALGQPSSGSKTASRARCRRCRGSEHPADASHPRRRGSQRRQAKSKRRRAEAALHRGIRGLRQSQP